MTEKVYIATLGCKVNQADSEDLAEIFASKGIALASSPNEADICLINTCTVTAKADLQSRQLIRKLKRENPKAKVYVTGCYANISGETIKKLPEVDKLLPINDLKNEIEKFGETEQKISYKAGKSRPQIKVQDGCDSFCSYCIVPYARGRSRSVSVKDVVANVANAVKNGAREVVLTGVHLGNFGKDLNPPVDLTSLLKELNKIKSDNFRIRLSSIEPQDFSEKLIEYAAKSNNVCHHFHIPMQSGADEILKKMKRRYSTSEYRNLILKIKSKMPEAAVGTDVIVGFPGETEELFEKTLNFIKELPIDYLHVFPYSKRPGTEAANEKETANNKQKKARVGILKKISDEKKSGYFKKFLNERLKIVVEGEKDKGMFKGVSENYIPVHFTAKDVEKGELVRVIITKIENLNVFGKLEE